MLPYDAIAIAEYELTANSRSELFINQMSLLSIFIFRIITHQNIKAADNQKVEAQRLSFNLKFKIDHLLV
ncbi:hypothetical protein [Nostoc sp. 106C]|jgi:hypothetical protein|uniref:hypothetical protein n=1 Tax=Nostoc sp. 106C TaxID=1932667 RepID=UPI000A3B5482|nr:hypothetical protein [Nostoc sp. 106C]OUL20499.1 hypothetical protein BV378_29215 [Nostoc sp. RF31YmG]OUL34323.1 hypothetical protein BV375_04735 [Nostoc sp. 106C]